MKKILFMVWLVGLNSLAAWAQAPGYASTENIVPKTTTALIAEARSCAHTTEPGYFVMGFIFAPGETLWGNTYTNEIRVAYKEFVVEAPPLGEHVSYNKFTGSGIEIEAKPGEKYICFLSERNGLVTLLRLEPSKSKQDVLKAYEEFRKKTSQPRSPANGGQPIPSGTISTPAAAGFRR